MIVVLRKRKLMIFLSLIMSVAIISLCTALPALNENRPFSVIIDPGHGGEDGGAIGSLKIPEKEINLKIGLLLRDLLIQNGIEVLMTRETDVSLHNKGAESINKRKLSDLVNRKKIANNSNADMMISIHMNHFGNPKYKGVQIFYQPNSEESKKIALMLKDSISESVGEEKPREVLKLDSKLIATKTKIPAVIVECGFLTNPEEEKLLIQDDYQQKLAQGMANCISKLKY